MADHHYAHCFNQFKVSFGFVSQYANAYVYVWNAHFKYDDRPVALYYIQNVGFSIGISLQCLSILYNTNIMGFFSFDMK